MAEPAVAIHDRDPTTEDRLLASMFWRTQDEVHEVRALLRPSSFATPENRVIYGAMSRILDRGDLVDVELLKIELEQMERLEDVGGLDRLAALMGADEVTVDPLALARHVHAEETRRSLERALREGSTTEEILQAVHEVALDRETGSGSATRRAAVPLREAAEASGREPPTASIARLVYPGRLTLLAAREKFGKSTLAGAAMAARTSGFRFLNESHETGSVLYWFGAKEGHLEDVAGSLIELGADPDRLHLLEEGVNPFLDLEAEVERLSPDVVVIDTLSAFVGGLEMESADKRWDSIMGRFARLARDSGAGFLILHHARKSDNKYIGSIAIGGGVDVILEMDEGEVQGVRTLEVKTRRGIRLDDYSVRFVEASDGFPPYFELTTGDMSLDAKVLLYVEANPGCTTNDVKSSVKGRATDVGSAIHRLAGTAIENRGSDRRSAWYAKDGRL